MYEIPQPLQHQEQIIFGLTAKQLFYAAAGIFPSLLLLKATSFYVSIPFSILMLCISTVFMFFDGEKWVKACYNYLHFRHATFQKQLKKQLVVKKVTKEGIVFIEGKQKKRLALLNVTPLNFGIKTKEDQEILLLQFQRFLNAVDFPIQIVMTTMQTNIDSYLKALESKNTEYMPQKESHKQHLQTLTEVQNRYFYLVVPEVRDSLAIQVEIVAELLKSMGLQVKQLKQEEIISLYQHYFNTKTQKELRIERTEEDAFHAVITPNEVKHTPTYLTINGAYNRILYAAGYPRTVVAGFLDKIISSKGDFDVSLFIEPYPYEDTLLYLNRELQKQNADLYGEKLKSILNPSLEIQYGDTRTVLESLQKGDERLFNVSLFITCKAQNEQELELLTKRVESVLNSILIQPQRAILRMTDGYLSMLPVGINYIGEKRNITTKALSAFFPFTSQFLTVEKSGILFGLNKNNAPVIKNIFSLANHNGIVLSSSGSGKSFFSKLFIARQLINGCKVLVIDPQNEYVELVKRFNGQLVNISRGSDTIINPLDVMEHDYAEKRLALLDLCKLMFGDLSEIQRAILDKAFNEVYFRKGFTADTNGKVMPTLSDVEVVLEVMAKDATSYEKPTYRAILNRLNMFTQGAFSFLNKQTKLDFSNRFVCFTIGDMPKQVKPIMMFLILDYVYMKMKQDKDRKLLVVDEAWSLLSRAEEASYLFEIVKTCRKFNMGLLMITQDVEDLLGSKAGHAVLANSAYSLLLRQKPAVMLQMSKVFNLSEKEKTHLLSAPIGKGLLIMENDHTELDIVASEWEIEMAISSATLPSPAPKKTVMISERLDMSVSVYSKAKLTADDVNFLQEQGYVLTMQVPIGKQRSEGFMVKKNAREGIDHIFLVWNVVEHVKKYTDKIETYETVKPDIVFEVNGQKWAVEVETGSNAKEWKHKRIKEKVAALKKEYGQRYFFFVGDTRYSYFYKPHGKVLNRDNFIRALAEISRSLAENK